ncbi:hypothetical protein MRB53_023128 [Persea americana]|uniref:Uncharacterized protein n=1 Tax=Persea americana TaxID=3435 RepID=A0ACC2L8N7_PERAE|nr:hypothetical protein MRB53_023128 [Persea americana]
MSSPIPATNSVESVDVRPLRFLVWKSGSSSSATHAVPGNSATQVFFSIKELHQQLLYFDQRRIFDGNNDGATKSKKPVWNVPANGIIEVHPVMGASWPVLSEGANEDQVKFYKEADDKNPTSRVLHGLQPAVSFSGLIARAAQNRAVILFLDSGNVVGCRDLGDNGGGGSSILPCKSSRSSLPKRTTSPSSSSRIKPSPDRNNSSSAKKKSVPENQSKINKMALENPDLEPFLLKMGRDTIVSGECEQGVGF